LKYEKYIPQTKYISGSFTDMWTSNMKCNMQICHFVPKIFIVNVSWCI